MGALRLYLGVAMILVVGRPGPVAFGASVAWPAPVPCVRAPGQPSWVSRFLCQTRMR